MLTPAELFSFIMKSSAPFILDGKEYLVRAEPDDVYLVINIDRNCPQIIEPDPNSTYLFHRSHQNAGRSATVSTQTSLTGNDIEKITTEWHQQPFSGPVVSKMVSPVRSSPEFTNPDGFVQK